MSATAKDNDCIFCKIIAGEIPSNFVYRDEDVSVFSDINPVSPVHLLVVPTKHIPSLAGMSEEDIKIFGKMAAVANKVAREQGISESGYRLTVNSGADGGQLVPHLHMHLMGGRELKWEY